MYVGQEIRDYMIENDIPQNKLALVIHMKPAKLNLVLTGKRKLEVDEYATICWGLNVDVDKFIKPHKPEGKKGA
jgi:DNA-binding Xre family transcriptional regulator